MGFFFFCQIKQFVFMPMSGWSPGLRTRQSVASEESPGCAHHFLAHGELQWANIDRGAAPLSPTLRKLDGGTSAVTGLSDGHSPHARLSAISQSSDEFLYKFLHGRVFHACSTSKQRSQRGSACFFNVGAL